MKTISYEEAIKLLGDKNPIEGDYPGYVVHLYEGNTKIEGDLELDQSEETDNIAGVLVIGDLDVSGSVLNYEGDSGIFLCVTSSLHAENIIAGGSEIYILGNATVKNTIYAFYNDGSFSVGGDTKARVIMNSGHFFELKGSVDGLKIALRNDDDIDEPDFYPDEVPEILQAKYIEASGGMNGGELLEAILSGKEFLKTGALSRSEKVDSVVKKYLQEKGKVTDLDLSERRFTHFPEVITSLKNLKTLNLNGNRFRKIPKSISQLTELETLLVEGCALVNLPKEIGLLHNLKTVSINYNPGIALPEEFSQLKNLRTFSAYNCFKVFPEVLASLLNLEELVLSGTNDAYLTEFPQSICRLTKLKYLDLSGHQFKSIPEEILNLENLEELNLDASLGYLKSIPDFSKLKNLKTLHFNGRMINVETVYFDGTPTNKDGMYPPHTLLELAFKATSIEHLFIERWGKEEKEINGKKVVVREELNTLPESIGFLTELKTLDLSYNNITHFPESFYALKNLTEVNLHRNKEFTLEEFNKMKARLPHTKVIVTGIPLRDDSTDENWQKVHALVGEANKIMGERKYKEAIDKYDEVISLCGQNSKWSEYDNLYAYYGKMYSISHLIPSIEDLALKTKAKSDQEAVSLQCLEIVKQQDNPMYFSDQSAFYCEVKRIAYNGLAWRMMERTEKTDTAHLEKALHFADLGVQVIEGNNGLYIWDTKVRILLKMGKAPDAYLIVERVLNDDPLFGDFQDIKESKEYKQWKKTAEKKTEE